MRKSSPWATTTRSALFLVAMLPLFACGSASEPTEVGVDGTGPVDTTSLKPIPKPPTPGPIFPTICSFDPRTEHVTTCDTTQPYGSSSTVTLDSCIESSATSSWAFKARLLMNSGCSAPLYWEAWNPYSMSGFNEPLSNNGGTYDQANAYLMLCPPSAASTVASMGCSVYEDATCQTSTSPCVCETSTMTYNGFPVTTTFDAAHVASGSFCDTTVPMATDGWFWAVTWEDPMCPSGCMLGSCKP